MVSHNVPRTTRPRTQAQREQDLEKIRKYRELEQTVRQRTAQSLYDEETHNLCSKLLRLNPEYYTVWNIRRRCLISAIFVPPSGANAEGERARLQADNTGCDVGDSHLIAQRQDTNEDTIRSELVFTVPILMEFPKCYWIWKYRLWMLQQAIERLPLATARNVWEDELSLVGKMLHRDRRNFHAWGYRRHVVSQLEGRRLSGGSMAEDEFDYTTAMIHMDLSNFSAWHNRSQLIPRLLDERDADKMARRRFLDDELRFVQKALNVGPEDQSLWYYHQFLMHAVCEATGRGPIVADMPMEDRQTYLNKEIGFIQELLEDYSDVKWIYEALVEYTLATNKMTTRGVQEGEKDLLAGWLQQLRNLDKKRLGRWKELEMRLGIL